MQLYLVSIWTDAMVRPFFYKEVDEGDMMRPILCSESLVNLAIGALVSWLQKAIAHACGPRQYGAGRTGGQRWKLPRSEQLPASAPPWNWSLRT